MKTENLEFGEALQMLAARAGLEIGKRGRPEDAGEREVLQKAMQEAQGYFRAQFSASLAAKRYCEGRGLTPEVLDKWEIGYAPDHGEGLVNRLKKAGLPLQTCKDLFLVDQDRSGGFFDKFRHRLMFPIYDERAQLVGFGGRVIGDGQPKYMNSSDTKLYRKSKVLYGLKVARDPMSKTRKAVLVEGYLDTIACHASGVTTAVASLGTALAEDQARLLHRFADEVTVLYDQDPAGQKAAERAIEILRSEGLKVKIASLPEGDDPDTVLRRDGPQAVLGSIKDATSPTSFRLRKLEARISPEQEEFWTEAITILADASENLEREGHLVRLAGMYPNIRDVRVAHERLTKMVDSARKDRGEPAKPTKPRSGTRQASVLPQDPLQQAETVVFGALFEPQFQKYAWIALKTTELLTTHSAVELAEAVQVAFPTEPPSGPPLEWIHRIEPEHLRQRLSDVNLNFHLSQLTEQLVVDSIHRLRQQAIQRDLVKLRAGSLSAEERQEVLRRLKILKPDGKAKPADDHEDPYART
jgi:DNA primase